ncbi:MAG: PAS domain S-box protein, partial [Melioribacteraceae bacterium]|nr:PAS domain S-box protein [Melioribacteraceae bacterium]
MNDKEKDEQSLRKISKETHRISEEKLRIIASSAKNAILVMDDEGKISYFNKAAEKIFGYLEHEAIGQSLHGLLTPERFLEAHRIGFRHFIKTGEGPAIGKTLELSAMKKNGTEFPIELSLSAFKSEGKWNAVGVVNDITERKKIEKSLVDSEARFRALVESSSDWIWEVDTDARYVYASPQVKEMLGYEVDEIIGKTAFDLMTEEDAKVLSKTFSDIVKAESRFDSLINANYHKDGSIVILETSGVPIIDKDGILIGYRGIDRNITKRVKAEKTLEKVKERLLLFFQQSPFAIIEWDLDFKVIDWNPAAEKIFGYTKAEALGRNAKDLIIPEDVKMQVDEIWSALLSQQGGLRSTNRNVTKEGNTILCSWYNTPLVDKSGKVIGVSSITEDVTFQEESKRKIQHMAYYDFLTDLPNRILFKDRLKQEFRKADREKNIVGVLFMDMDHFKTINDTLGHFVGDMLLKEVAQRLKETFRKSDTISRFGGDEFAIIIPNLTRTKDIYILLKSVINKFKIPFKVFEHEFFVTFSTGITFYPLDDTDMDILIRDADTAMHHAKRLGRNQYQRYHSRMTQEINNHFTLQNDLRHAIDRKELMLYYQPQVNSQSGNMTGVEALIRWNHPKKGLISPADFIPIAEDSGLIV